MSSKSLDISLPTLRLPNQGNEAAGNFPFKKTIANEPQRLTYEQIGSQLLQDELLLSALELYMEVAETGHEIQCLKQFFSNPGNFEKPTNHHKRSGSDSSRFLVRSSSQVTLDSLDFAHLSEDGDRSGVDDRIAVLEFELRKARETISVLRANLTQAAAEQENCSSNSDNNSIVSQHRATSQTSLHAETLKPYDRKALNFLIHEYLLTNGYRLTSVTFADENPEQDFEHWDDVGLNIERPPDLFSIYRRRNLVLSHPQTSDSETQTEDECILSPKSDTQTVICDAENENDGEADITIQGVSTSSCEPVPLTSNTAKALKDELQQGVEDVYQKLNHLFTSGNRSSSQFLPNQEPKNLNPVSQLAGIFRKKL